MAGRKKNNTKRSFRRKVRKSRYGKMTYKGTGAKPFPFGQQFKTKLTTAFTQAVSATPVADYVVNASSLYSNGVTATQAIGFDELMSVYTKYRVSGVKITAKFINTHASTPVVASVIPSNSAVSITSLNSARAMSGGVSRVCLAGGQQNRPSIHKLYRDSAYVVGVNKQTYKDDEYSGTATTNPSVMWYIHLNTNAIDEASATSGYWLVNIVYYATFYHRKNLLLS